MGGKLLPGFYLKVGTWNYQSSCLTQAKAQWLGRTLHDFILAIASSHQAVRAWCGCFGFTFQSRRTPFEPSISVNVKSQHFFVALQNDFRHSCSFLETGQLKSCTFKEVNVSWIFFSGLGWLAVFTCFRCSANLALSLPYRYQIEPAYKILWLEFVCANPVSDYMFAFPFICLAWNRMWSPFFALFACMTLRYWSKQAVTATTNLYIDLPSNRARANLTNSDRWLLLVRKLCQSVGFQINTLSKLSFGRLVWPYLGIPVVILWISGDDQPLDCMLSAICTGLRPFSIF